MGRYKYHTACPACTEQGEDNNGDNLAVYDDNTGYCFKCKYYCKKVDKEQADLEDVNNTSKTFTPIVGTPMGLPARKISAKVANEYGYFQDKDIQVANYYHDGKLVGQKVRTRDKDFWWNKGAPGRVRAELFGQHLCKKSGKMLVITEGEIDAMSCREVLGTWPCVSVIDGASSAVQSIKDNLEFVNSYEKVILCFDEDEPGKKAAQEVAQILPPGKAFITSLPYKDANECLVNNAVKQLYNCIWEAQQYSPDEVLHVSNIETNNNIEGMEVWETPFDGLTEALLGQRPGEITLWTSGTGSGKTTILKEFIFHHLQNNRSVGAIMLEESPEETKDDLLSYILNKPIRALRASKIMNRLREKMGKSPIHTDFIDDLSDEEYARACEELDKTKLFIYDHLGNSAMANLLNRIEFMATALGVDVIVLDHITAAVTGIMSARNGEFADSERLVIDEMMKELRSIAVRTGVRIDIISQLKKTHKAYEEGDRITLQDLRGSGSLSSVPNTVLALERNRQHEDPIVANTTVVRILKDRLTGKSGIGSCLYYDRSKGKLEEIGYIMDDNGNIVPTM